VVENTITYDLPCWDDLKAVMRTALDSEEVANHMVFTLEPDSDSESDSLSIPDWDDIDDWRQGPVHKLFLKIKNTKDEIVKHDFTVHCEATLAAYSKLRHATVHPCSISVSRLCCPVCWELMRVLRKDSDNFQVCGHHNRLMLLDLPHYLPAEAVSAMVVKFRSYLANALKVLNRVRR